jgi:hypothetical protein
MSKFKYNARTVEDVQRKAKQSSGRYDSFLTDEVSWFKPKSGENVIRLLPWLNAADKDFKALDKKWGNHWGIDIIVHNNVGPDNGAYLCLDKMNGEPCPICDAWRTDGIDAIKPGDRVLCRLIDRNEEKSGPQVWSMPLGVSKDISAVSIDKKGGGLLLIDDWEEGYDVFFDKEGEKLRTQYKRISLDREASRLAGSEAQEEDWLDQVFDKPLPDLLKFYPAEYLDKVLSGQKEAGGEDEPRERLSRRRDSDDGEAIAPSRDRRRRSEDDTGGDREERTSRGREDLPWDGNGRDRKAESDNEANEARASRRSPDPEPEAKAEPSTARERLKDVGRRRR